MTIHTNLVPRTGDIFLFCNMTSMFYEGDLESGISIALRESKFVACFVRDDGEESSKWEDEYLGDAQVKAALTDRAITLRIQAGSQEAGFLAAYYPVQAVPALVIIQYAPRLNSTSIHLLTCCEQWFAHPGLEIGTGQSSIQSRCTDPPYCHISKIIYNISSPGSVSGGGFSLYNRGSYQPSLKPTAT